MQFPLKATILRTFEKEKENKKKLALKKWRKKKEKQKKYKILANVRGLRNV